MVTNVTGWNELYSGNLISATYKVFDVVLGGWTIVVLFFVFQALLYIKTRNIVMMWITGIFFIGMYVTSAYVGVILKQESITYMVALLILELAGILYLIFFK